MKDLPIYDITIEDDAEIQGVSKISLVDVPAIGVNWIALRKVELKLQDVFGYETQHFDICPGAQATFKNYSEMQLDEDTIGMIRSAAQNADNVFEIEKRVIQAGKATREDLEQVKILVADFKDIISEIDKITGQPQNVDYMNGHIKVVEDLMPKTMMAVRMRKRKMVLAKKECLACPPNGDGTRVNGEPDKRCKGDGAEKTPKGGGKASGKPSGDFQNPKSSEDFTGPKAVEQANNSYVDAIINETTNALTQEYFPDWLKNKQSPPDGPDKGRDYHTAAMRYLGIENDKTWDYDKGKPTKSEPGQKRKVTDLGGYKEVQWSFKKQTFAKKECLACPPNGDGTRVNGEPDRRCKDTKGDGAGKTPKAAGPKAKGAGAKDASKSEQTRPAYGKVLTKEEYEGLYKGYVGYDIKPDDEVVLSRPEADGEERIQRYENDLRKSGLTEKTYGISDVGQKTADILSGDIVQLTNDEYSSLLLKVNNTMQIRDGVAKSKYQYVQGDNPNELHVRLRDGWSGYNIVTINTEDKTIKAKPYSVDRETGKPRRISKDALGTTKRDGIDFDNNPKYMEPGFLMGGKMPKVNYSVTFDSRIGGDKRRFRARPWAIQ